MKRSGFVTGAVLAALLVTFGSALAGAQDKPSYTPQEYNAYKACADDKVAQQRARCLEDFVVKFPESQLLPYAYQLGYTSYNELKSYPKSIEWADRLLALGEKLDLGTRIQAVYIRSYNFNLAFSEKAGDAADQARRAREAALQGVDLIGKLPKPEQMSQEQFDQQKKTPLALFHYTAGFAALQVKDYKAAVASFQNALANNPNDAVTYYRMGLAHLQMDPPQQMEGFWALARSIALKGPGEAQVRSYLRSQVARYQLTACDAELDAQLNELITLASGSATRPAGYKIPSAADLDAARKNQDWLGALKGGGEAAKVTWLAMCGQPFQEVYARVFEVAPGNDSITLKVYVGATSEEVEAATGPNCEVKVTGEPRAANFQKDDQLRFSGTLGGYTPAPFLIRWDGAKINPEDLPEDKPAPGKQPAKRPSSKRPTKRPPPR